MRAAVLVGVLIFIAGLSWLWGNERQRQRMQRKTREAFQTRGRARDRPFKSPLARMHPAYERWLRQAGSKRTPATLERQQWLLGLTATAIVRLLADNWYLALILGAIAFVYPVLEVRAKARTVAKSVATEMRLFILLLQVYVKAGVSYQQALRLVETYLRGHLRRILRDTRALMSQMTFEEAMQVAAQQSPSEDLEVVAKALMQTKYGSKISESLNHVIEELNHQEALRLGSKQRQAKMGVYMKFLMFFVTPLILDVGLFVWGMIRNAAVQL
ncbi:type II secretion system F family protein [Alicyclobacillus macrosporangiidus]|uniref:Type II secretion system (T2SS), protein F n=1 Tax=Alicyclobacillus macrosporangiidus TaxID=392015 RepID=A0A1I7KFM3_9BACL|nr:type II secretion system F family protein [Alicyclobacillus macrosporangiidus]SFU96174.1 Type II secretion system (T2SS), protein F [Alicyclobacillus macrosporangiidus]